MAITAKRMTGLHIERAAQKPGRHGVGDGLMLQVRAPGKASWLWRFQFDGRRRDMGFGPWPEVPLAKARERLFKAKQVLEEGRDPLEDLAPGRIGEGSKDLDRVGHDVW